MNNARPGNPWHAFSTPPSSFFILMPIQFHNPGMLGWLWLVPALAGLLIHAAIQRGKAIRTFGATAARVNRNREALASCAAVALVTLALARPAWGVREEALLESGRDVIFLLDVSRSMLAEDLHPNRLENAKTAILDCVESLSGDRLGLVLFAGSAEIRCPLTVDYDYFRMALRQASPLSVAAGGTRIANALDKVVDKLIDPDKAGLQDLILITDGEDMVEGSEELVATRALVDSGGRLIAIGLGDHIRGSRIPLKDEETGTRTFLKHDRREVWTRLHPERLRQMATAAPGGIYVDVAAGPFDLRHIYREVMENAPLAVMESGIREHDEDRFQLFLAGAICMILISHRWRAW